MINLENDINILRQSLIILGGINIEAKNATEIISITSAISSVIDDLSRIDAEQKESAIKPADSVVESD